MPKPKTDPALPAAFLAALERVFATRRSSGGVLIGGLGGELFFASRLRDALKARYDLSGANLDEAEILVLHQVRQDLAPPPREPSDSWVNQWAADVPRRRLY